MDRPLTVNWILPLRRARLFRKWKHSGNPASVWNYNDMPASVWNRCLEMLPYLEELGVRCLVNDRRERADVVAFVRNQDDASAQRAREAKAAGARVVLDLCVNYYDVVGVRADGSGSTEAHRAEVLAMTALADAITTASPFIADRARAHAPHARVQYFPDSIDRAHFRERKAYPSRWDAPPTAIWCGYAHKAHCLAPLGPMLTTRGMPLVIICNKDEQEWRRIRASLPGAELIKWEHGKLPQTMLRGDVCLSPRELDNPYDRGHSCFKIGIFLAQGIPALASRVPSYADVLHQDKTGLFCESPGEWAAALDRVAGDPRVLAEWGAAAADVMQPHWSTSVAAGYAKLFRELCDG